MTEALHNAAAAQSEPLVAINIPNLALPPEGKTLESRIGSMGRPELLMGLYNHGIDVVFTHGAQAYDHETGQVETIRPQLSRTVSGFGVELTSETHDIGDFDLVFNLSKVLNCGVTEVNHPRVRDFTLDKAAFDRLSTELKSTKPHSILNVDDPAAAFDVIPGDNVVVKGLVSGGSRHVHVGTKQEMLQKIADGEIAKSRRWIVEPRYTFQGLPVKTRDPNQQDALYNAISRGAPAEVRTYCYGRNEQGELVRDHVARVALNGGTNFKNNQLIFLDEAAIPDAVLDLAERFYDGIAQKTGVSDMHISLDAAYVTGGGATHPRWIMMEGNSRPGRIYTHEEPWLALEQGHKLAAMLHKIITKQ